MKIKIFKSINNIKFNIIDFPNKYNFLLITGLSGSGKSTYANALAQKYNAKIISLDGLSSSYKSTLINEDTKHLIYKFIKENPSIEKELRGNFWQKQKLNNFDKYKYWNNLFFDFIIKNINKNTNLYIIEGTHIFMTIDPKKIVNYPIIVMGTSDIKSFFKRINRQLSKSEPFIQRLKHLKKLVNDSKRLHYKDYKKLNIFLSKLN